VLENLVGRLNIIERATIVRDGKLTSHYEYLKEYASEIMKN
jgi:hypothetical protein